MIRRGSPIKSICRSNKKIAIVLRCALARSQNVKRSLVHINKCKLIVEHAKVCNLESK